MKKFFTLFAAAFAAFAVNAQTWNFSEWEAGDYESAFTKDGLTLDGGKWTIDGNNKTVDGVSYTQRAKSGGKNRTISFEVSGNSTITYIACTSSTDNPREATVTAGDAVVKAFEINALDKYVVEYEGGAATIVLTTTGGGLNFYAIKVEAAETPVDPGEGGGDEPEVEPQGTPETFVAVSYNGEEYVANDLFTNAVIENGASTVVMSTANMEAIGVGGTTAKDVYQEAGTDFAGWTEWNDVKWDVKNQGDIQFGYILGTGNPAVAFDAEEVLSEDARTGHYRPVYTYYEADGSKGMPLMGLYYKFSPKVDGQLKVNVWSNKGNRNTFIVDEDTAKPIKYKAEGYVNGQNEGTGEFDENGNEIQRKKWLSAEEIQFIHDNAKCEKDADGNVIPGTDSAPWVIAAGNQPFWGTLTVSLKAGKTYWLFQHSSQIGFQSYTFTPNEAGGESISSVEAEQGNVIFNLRGERVNGMVRGQIYLQNGKKVLFR